MSETIIKAYTVVPTTYEQATGTSVVEVTLGINHKGLKYLKGVRVSEPTVHAFAVDELLATLNDEVFYPMDTVEQVKYPTLVPLVVESESDA